MRLWQAACNKYFVILHRAKSYLIHSYLLRMNVKLVKTDESHAIHYFLSFNYAVMLNSLTLTYSYFLTDEMLSVLA